MWRTPRLHSGNIRALGISIRVLRVEDDICTHVHHMEGGNFNPRPPCGGRRWLYTVTSVMLISIRVLRVEDDPGYRARYGWCELISIRVLRVEDD